MNPSTKKLVKTMTMRRSILLVAAAATLVAAPLRAQTMSVNDPVLQGIFLIMAVFVVVASILADITNAYLDPRIREAVE